jgi:hypothetical protein
MSLVPRVLPVGTVTFSPSREIRGKTMSPENSKPEWFQMADADATPPRPKSKRAIRIMALATPLFVLGAGLAIAQNQSVPNAVASLAVTVQTTAVTAATPASSVAVAAQASSPIKISQAASTTTPAAVALAKPGIKLPSGDGEDDSSQAVLTSSNVATTSHAATITKPGITNPAIATLPTRSGDDDHKTSNGGDDDYKTSNGGDDD